MRLIRAIFFAAAIGIPSGFVTPAQAQNCPGNPDALGTSRVIVVGPAEYIRLGTMQYRETLPLNDKEVVLTFDDGPIPPYSDKILDILNSECVKATYFIVGSMARHYPDVVRREFAAGHTIGSHSQNHPLRFQKMSGNKLRREIDDGIASVSGALSDPKDLAPYFRIPGLYRTDEIERELAARSLVTFSADVDADDWHRHVTPEQIIKLAMSRLEKRGKGSILLLHDIHPATVAALPGLLKELKDHGYHIVQVVPPTQTEPKTAREPKAWPVPGMPDQILIYGSAAPSWPQSNAGLALDNISGPELPVPSVQDIGVSLQGQILGAELGAKSNLHRHKQLLSYRRISSLRRQYSGHQSEKDRSWLNGGGDQKYKGERPHTRRPSQREEKRQSARQ